MFDLPLPEPPPSNRGVPSAQPPLQEPLDLSTPARFDWYGASVSAPIDPLRAALEAATGTTFEPTRPLLGYHHAERLPGSIRLLYGGQNPDPYVQATGQDAPAIADFLRASFDHRVSRADVCVDFDGRPRLFEDLQGLVDPCARSGRVSVRMISDPAPDSEKGRTIYFGAMKTSDVVIRLYEKGREQIETGANLKASPTWVRLELVLRPRKARKVLAATLPPAALFGFSKWSAAAYEAVMNEHTPFIPDTSLRQNPDDVALDFLARQYGRLLRRRIEAQGWESLNLDLYRAIYSPKERAIMERDQPAPRFLRSKRPTS